MPEKHGPYRSLTNTRGVPGLVDFLSDVCSLEGVSDSEAYRFLRPWAIVTPEGFCFAQNSAAAAAVNYATWKIYGAANREAGLRSRWHPPLFDTSSGSVR